MEFLFASVHWLWLVTLKNMVGNMLHLENHIGASLVSYIGYGHTTVFLRCVFIMSVYVPLTAGNGCVFNASIAEK